VVVIETRRGETALVGHVGARIDAREACASVVVDLRELRRERQIAVRDEFGIGRMVVTRVEGDELLVREVRNVGGRAARVVAVGGGGEERLFERLRDGGLRIGHGALHLVVDDAVNLEILRRGLRRMRQKARSG
jgi:hypothetical protein